MLERGAEMLRRSRHSRPGARHVDKAYIGIENNKPDAIEHLTTTEPLVIRISKSSRCEYVIRREEKNN